MVNRRFTLSIYICSVESRDNPFVIKGPSLSQCYKTYVFSSPFVHLSDLVYRPVRVSTWRSPVSGEIIIPRLVYFVNELLWSKRRRIFILFVRTPYTLLGCFLLNVSVLLWLGDRDSLVWFWIFRYFSVYSDLGFINPLLLSGRRIYQGTDTFFFLEFMYFSSVIKGFYKERF